MPDRANLTFELALWGEGFRAVAGVDEVGRGALAGPVVAAAVILPPDASLLAPLLGRVDDSKALTAKQREAVVADILRVAVGVGVGRCEAGEIDAQGIAPATRCAMGLALDALRAAGCAPDFILLDYLTLPAAPCPQRGIPHGDALSLSIAAASVVAKVTRDAWMREQEGAFPGYGFTRHKGYGTAEHRAAILALGPCALHRMSFAPLNGEAMQDEFEFADEGRPSTARLPDGSRSAQDAPQPQTPGRPSTARLPDGSRSAQDAPQPQTQIDGDEAGA